MELLQGILDEIGPTQLHRLSEVPKMVDLSGFGQFLQNLKNQGMHPHLMGDFPVERGGEAFNPHFLGYPKTDEILGISQETRDANPQTLLRQIKHQPSGIDGFRTFTIMTHVFWINV